jgi:glutathione S-transferase
MIGKRLLIHSTFLFLLPVLVAWLGISVAGAIGLILLALLWRWAISMSIWVAPAKVPELELETISASHFVEKVRWCMDRLGVPYTEKPVGGTLGAFFLGRSVPLLKFKSGAVRSSIGNSSEILRYLWGRYAVEEEESARFLEPTPERLELESSIDRCGVDLQLWVYFHILPDRELTLHAWGCNNPAIPSWQRLALRLLYPLLSVLVRSTFRITPTRYEKAVAHIDSLLADVELKLADGRNSILGGEQVNFTDLSFAAIMGLWLQPREYGGGKADAVRIEKDQCPEAMIEQIDAWSSTFPLATVFIEQTYRTERTTADSPDVSAL